MSPHQNVDRDRIRLFLERLAARFQRPARIYLVGGTSLVYEKLREQSLDIDLAIDVAPQFHSELLSAIRDLKDELSVNVEEAFRATSSPCQPAPKAVMSLLRGFESWTSFTSTSTALP